MSGVAPLNAEMLSTLLALELLSHGAVQAWNPSGGHSGEPDDRTIIAVMAIEDPPHEHYRALYAVQATDYGRRDILERARSELAAWRKRSQPIIESKSLSELIVEDGEGWMPEIVAQRFGVAAAFVRRLRVKAERDIEHGRRLETPGGRAQWAQALSARGLTQAQIAGRMGVSQPTVHRLLKARIVHSAA